MNFKKALLKEEINQALIDAIKKVRTDISAHTKIKKYVDAFDPIGTPFAYVLSNGKKYSLHCDLKWTQVNKKAADQAKDLNDQNEIMKEEENVANEVVRGIKDYIIGLDYMDYNPKVTRKENDKVIQIVFSIPKTDTTPTTMEEPITPPEESTPQDNTDVTTQGV